MPFSDGSMESDFRNKLTVAKGWLHIAMTHDRPDAIGRAAAEIDLISELLNYWTAQIPEEFRAGKGRIEELAELRAGKGRIEELAELRNNGADGTGGK